MPNEPEFNTAGTDAGSLKKFRVQEDDVFGLWRGGVGSTICSSFIIAFLIGVVMSRAVDTGRYLWRTVSDQQKQRLDFRVTSSGNSTPAACRERDSDTITIYC